MRVGTGPWAIPWWEEHGPGKAGSSLFNSWLLADLCPAPAAMIVNHLVVVI